MAERLLSPALSSVPNGGEGDQSNVRPGSLAAVGGGLAVADVIEAVLELLPATGVLSGQKCLPEMTWPRVSYW